MNRIPADPNSPGAAFPPVRPDDGHCDGQAVRLRDGGTVDWEHLRRRLAAVRGRWDLAVLANLAGGAARPGDLIEAINAQSEEERRISWKVLTETLRRLEDEGYVGHKEISRLPRVTRYWLMPPGYRLVSSLCLLDAWYREIETGAGCPDQPGSKEPPAGQADDNADVQPRTVE